MGSPDDDIPISFEDRELEAPSYARALIVVGGGRGGLGKTLTATNLAVYFAQLGKTVVLVDADGTGANVHTHFGLSAAREALSPDEGTSFDDARVMTAVPGLSILPYAHDAVRPPLALRAGRKARWLARVRSLPADYIVVDVGPGYTEFQLDLLLSADAPLLVTTPEPPAIEATYRLLRMALVRRLRRTVTRDRLRLATLDRTLANVGYIPPPVTLARLLGQVDSKLGEFATTECARMVMHLVVNQTRVRTDTELGAWMSELAKRHYGLRVLELGHIEYDDTVWLAVRRSSPLLLDSPASKASRNLERVARRVMALLTERERSVEQAPSNDSDLSNHYGRLTIGRSASDEEIRKAYKRKREVYATGSLAVSSLFDADGLRAEQGYLDEAYDTLLDPIRRRAYDLSSFGPEDPTPPEEPRPAIAAERLMLQSELLREVGPDTDFSGALLRKVRESQGIDLVEVSSKTKISRTYLHALEEESVSDLPANVYIRGFVTEYAKYLRLDASQVCATYMRRLRDARSAIGKSR